MSEPDADLTVLFRNEATQRLDQMDTALLAIEAGGGNAAAVDSLFRNAHTIKGGAGMLGFDDIRVLAHAIEDVLERVREAGVCPPAMAARLLRATAALRGQVAGQAVEAVEDVGDLTDELAVSLAMLGGDGDGDGGGDGGGAAAVGAGSSQAGESGGGGAAAVRTGSSRAA